MSCARRGLSVSVRGGNYKLGDKVVVCAPATSANLGCGYDSFGVALDLWTILEVTVSRQFKFSYESYNTTSYLPERGNDSNMDPANESQRGQETSIGKIDLEGLRTRARDMINSLNTSLPLDGSNAIVKAFMIGLRHLKCLPPEPLEFEFVCRTEVPISRGLGSSAAAFVVGIAAAFSFCKKDLKSAEVLEEMCLLACRIEGHPDNILPSIYGKMQIAIRRTEEDDRWMIDPNLNSDYIRQEVAFPSEEIACIVHIPCEALSTEKARGLLPNVYPKEEVVSNIGRSGLLVAALLSGEFEKLKFACQDKVHQPYRASFCPSFQKLLDVAPGTDALAIYLSGSGPSTVIWARTSEIYQLHKDLTKLLGFSLFGDFVFAKVSNIGIQSLK